MAEGTVSVPGRQRATDGKITATQTTAALSAGAAATATALWVVGCLKGHQLYWPDDALMLSWIAVVAGALHKLITWTGPLWQALGKKIYKSAGVEEGQ